MYYESIEDKIQRLESELLRARRTIVDLLPNDIKAVAESYWHVKSRREAHEWQSSVTNAVIELSWSSAQERAYSGSRAYCPLCKRGSSSPFDEGFKLPDGLRKHLLGEGNAYQCDVMHAVFELARPKIRDAEAAEEIETAREAAERLASEQLFRTDPRSEPGLVDKNLGWCGVARDDESMNWAIGRLMQLGFTISEENRVRAFTKDYGPVVVYADPREAGKIAFRMLRREQVENTKSRKRWSPDHESFQLQDAWKNDLLKKLDQRVEQAITRLVKPPAQK
jgi:hypothetical protein